MPSVNDEYTSRDNRIRVVKPLPKGAAEVVLIEGNLAPPGTQRVYTRQELAEFWTPAPVPVGGK
jgi:hypothetical protein